MSQNNISFEGSMTGASMLDDRLTPLLNNIYSSNSGSTRPAYLQAGGTWFDSLNGKLMLYNGVSEVALLTNSEDFANTDLSNLSARWSMPNYDAGIVISGYNSASNKFTAPCDGLIIMCGGGTANNAFNLVIDDEVYLFNNASTTYWVGQQFFIKKGSTFYYFGTLPEYGYRHFFPLEGAQ